MEEIDSVTGDFDTHKELRLGVLSSRDCFQILLLIFLLSLLKSTYLKIMDCSCLRKGVNLQNQEIEIERAQERERSYLTFSCSTPSVLYYKDIN